MKTDLLPKPTESVEENLVEEYQYIQILKDDYVESYKVLDAEWKDDIESVGRLDEDLFFKL